MVAGPEDWVEVGDVSHSSQSTAPDRETQGSHILYRNGGGSDRHDILRLRTILFSARPVFLNAAGAHSEVARRSISVMGCAFCRPDSYLDRVRDCWPVGLRRPSSRHPLETEVSTAAVSATTDFRGAHTTAPLDHAVFYDAERQNRHEARWWEDAR